jgi:methyltransferase-like protein
MNSNEVLSIQFRDNYIVIETLTRTHSIQKSDIGDGEWESLQAGLLQLSERGQKKKKYYSDHLDRL